MAAAGVADRVGQAALVVGLLRLVAFRIGDDNQVAALVVGVVPAVAGGVDFGDRQVEAVVPLGSFDLAQGIRRAFQAAEGVVFTLRCCIPTNHSIKTMNDTCGK